MIEFVEIKNFKSVKHLKLNCKKINILIGEPNTGKSNILEAISLLSFLKYASMKSFIRVNTLNELFYDSVIDYPIKILSNICDFSLYYENNMYHGKYFSEGKNIGGFSSEINEIPNRADNFQDKANVKFYKFKSSTSYKGIELDFLYPPFGYNLFNILASRKTLQDEIYPIFDKFELKLMLKRPEIIYEVAKIQDNNIYSFRYDLISDTLQRIIFYIVAILSNKNSTIILEEPESNSFPYYTKYLAEKIALQGTNNQFFITTHNPYLLLSIIEKTKIDELNVFLTYYQNYETKVKILTKKELEEVLDAGADVFFEIDKFLE